MALPRDLGNLGDVTGGGNANANFDSGTLFIDSVNNRVGIANTTPDVALRVTGAAGVSGNVVIGGTANVTGNVVIGGVIVGNLTVSGVVVDNRGSDVRAVPQNARTSAYTLTASDAGRHISITTGGVTVPASVFSVGDAVSIYNNSGTGQTIVQGGGVTLRLAGTPATGNRAIAQYGICTILCVATNTFVISGVGIG